MHGGLGGLLGLERSWGGGTFGGGANLVKSGAGHPGLRSRADEAEGCRLGRNNMDAE